MGLCPATATVTTAAVAATATATAVGRRLPRPAPRSQRRAGRAPRGMGLGLAVAVVVAAAVAVAAAAAAVMVTVTARRGQVGARALTAPRPLAPILTTMPCGSCSLNPTHRRKVQSPCASLRWSVQRRAPRCVGVWGVGVGVGGGGWGWGWGQVVVCAVGLPGSLSCVLFLDARPELVPSLSPPPSLLQPGMVTIPGCPVSFAQEYCVRSR